MTPQRQHNSSLRLRLRLSDNKGSLARSSARPDGNKGNSSIPPHMTLENKDSPDPSSEMNVPIPEKKKPLLIKLRVNKERRTDQRGAPPTSTPAPTPASAPLPTPHVGNTVDDKNAKKWAQNVIIIDDDDKAKMDSKADESSEEETVLKTPLTRSRVQPPRGRGASSSNATPQEVTPPADEGKPKRTGKQRFSLSLTKQEIEEDFVKLTGARPSTRPEKRPQELQKKLDILFPGSYLKSITRSSYRVRNPK